MIEKFYKDIGKVVAIRNTALNTNLKYYNANEKDYWKSENDNWVWTGYKYPDLHPFILTHVIKYKAILNKVIELEVLMCYRNLHDFDRKETHQIFAEGEKVIHEIVFLLTKKFNYYLKNKEIFFENVTNDEFTQSDGVNAKLVLESQIDLSLCCFEELINC